MKILWLSHFVPYPPKGGCFQRSFNLIKHISSRHEVYLISLRNKKSTHPDFDINVAQNELEKYCQEVRIVDISSSIEGASLYGLALKSLISTKPMSVNMFKSEKMRASIRELSERVAFDLVHFDTISLAVYFDDVHRVPKVLNHHGAESVMIKRRASNDRNLLNKLYLFIEWFKLRNYERRFCSRFDMNLAVSDLDRRLLAESTGVKNFGVIENGVDTGYFDCADAAEKKASIIFAGRLDQYSNRGGVEYFCKNIWPLVKEKVPNIRFMIIGANPPPKLVEAAASDDQIELLGYVDDVRPYFAKAMISVCPLRDGGGTRLKILDALAMGMPIVSTSIGCEGIEITPGKDVLIADTPAAFAEHIKTIASDASKRQEMRKNARQTAEVKYSWSVIGKKLEHIYSKFDSSSAIRSQR